MSRAAEIDAEALFRRLWGCRDITLGEIAAHYGVSKQAICERARRRGLPARGLRADAQIRHRDRPAFRAMWEGRVRIADMARHFGCSATVVQNTARCMGLAPRRRVRGQGGSGWGCVSLAEWQEARLAQAWRAQRAVDDGRAAHVRTR